MIEPLGQEEKPKTVETSAMRESMDIILNWKPTSEVFALKNFMLASAVLSSTSAFYINAHYRKVLRLRNHAYFSTLVPVIVAPAVVGGLLHHQFVHRPMLLETFKCPVCVELRGGMAQLFTGFVYPLLLAPLAGMQIAARLYTYPVPDARSPMKVVKEIVKITKPALPRFYVLAGLQVIGGMAWTHWEFYNLHTMLTRMGEMEATIQEHRKDKLKLD